MKHLNINYITKSYMNDQDSSSPKETDNVTFVIFSNYALKKISFTTTYLQSLGSKMVSISFPCQEADRKIF